MGCTRAKPWARVYPSLFRLGGFGHIDGGLLRVSKSNGMFLLVAAVGGFFAVFVDVLDDALENEQVWGALAG
jgi:hypothetical protein